MIRLGERIRVSVPGPLPSARAVGVALSYAVAGLIAACSSDTKLLSDNELPRPMDGRSLLCEPNLVRCSARHDAIEVCDGMSWRQQSMCNVAGGETCINGTCRSQCELLARDNLGCSFYPVNLWSTSLVGSLGIVVINPSDTVTASILLEDAGGPIESQQIPPALGNPMGGVAVFRLEHTRNKLGQTECAKKSFHLTSNAPVSAILFHPIDSTANDGTAVPTSGATLLLPEHVMAKDYFVMSYTYNAELITSPPQGQGFLAVVGLHDSTYLEITTPVPTKSGAGVPALQAGEPFNKFINRFEVLEIIQANSHEDISGARIKASAPVAVYGGAGSVSIPASAVGGSYLGVQQLPLQAWGRSYVAAEFKQRNPSDKNYYRILSSADSTHVKVIGGINLPSKVPILAAGQVFEFSTDSSFLIEADQPVTAFQYMVSWGNLSGRFDPAEFPHGAANECPFSGTADNVKCIGGASATPLVPVEQYRSDYNFYAPQKYKFNYVNITATLGTKLFLDGKAVTAPLKPISDDSGMITVSVLPGLHRISGSMPFGIISYGYDYAASYSYTGGLNLESID